MTNTRTRGKVGRDDQLFGSAKAQQKLKEAVADMNYLLSRGFAEKSSVQLVGNRYRLNARQQKAVQGMSASNAQLQQRQATLLSSEQLTGQSVIIDAFNVIILLESYYSEAYLFKGLDNCYRDISSVHGSYKRVKFTEEVLQTVGETLEKLNVNKVLWVFDKPVSNSGRLKQLTLDIAEQHGFNWDAILDHNPDKYIANSDKVAVTSDAWILDRASSWFNLIDYIVDDTSHIIQF